MHVLAVSTKEAMVEWLAHWSPMAAVQASTPRES